MEKGGEEEEEKISKGVHSLELKRFKVNWRSMNFSVLILHFLKKKKSQLHSPGFKFLFFLQFWSLLSNLALKFLKHSNLIARTDY